MKKLIIVSLYLILLPLSGFAKDLKLLQKPEDGASVITKVQSGDELITIYSPKDSKWLKVADPRNGKVGWVKKSDLSVEDSFNPAKQDQQGMYRQQFERKHRDKNGNVTGHERVEYYGTEKMNQQDLERMVRKMRLQQMRMHHMMNRMWDRQMMDPFDDPWFNDPFDQRPRMRVPVPQQNPQISPDRIIVPDTKNKSEHHIR